MIQLQDRWTEVRIGKSVVLRAVKPCSRYEKPHADNIVLHYINPRCYLAIISQSGGGSSSNQRHCSAAYSRSLERKNTVLAGLATHSTKQPNGDNFEWLYLQNKNEH